MGRQLWYFVEHMDWNRRWPRSFWRWLLRRIDRIYGFQCKHYDPPER